MRFKGMTVRFRMINGIKRRIPLLILSPVKKQNGTAAVMWIHGGGYFTGMKEMALFTRPAELVRKYGVTVISPGYRRALFSPYPAALTDCHAALIWLKKNCAQLGLCSDRIFVGGESAGGGLAAALCMLARDMGTVNIAYQMPVYPMLSAADTESSADNHGRVWNTRRNHFGWHMYLRDKEITKYASPSLETDYSLLPPCYTFVGDGEPFYRETLDYVENLKNAGVYAKCDVYHSDVHALDIYDRRSEIRKKAADNFNDSFEYALAHFRAQQGESDEPFEGLEK